MSKSMYLKVVSSFGCNTPRIIYIGIFYSDLSHMGYFSSMADGTFSTYLTSTVQKMKFSIKYFFCKCDQIRRKLPRISRSAAIPTIS